MNKITEITKPFTGFAIEHERYSIVYKMTEHCHFYRCVYYPNFRTKWERVSFDKYTQVIKAYRLLKELETITKEIK